MTKEEVKQRVCEAIVAAQPRLREIAESIKAALSALIPS